MTNVPVTLVRVTTKPWHRPAFCAGLVFHGARCVEAAPILGWARGKLWPDVKRYCQRRGWQTQALPVHMP